jgi:leader peptidase (prepilin peptidase)/N-methyltransferase
VFFLFSLDVYRIVAFIVLGAAVIYFDLRYREIPDWLNLLGLVLALPFSKDNILWSLAAGLVMLLLAVLSNNALGGGDVKFSAVMGLFLGSKAFFAIVAAYVVCAVVCLAMLLAKKVKKDSTIAFGPYLVFGGFYVMLGGEIFPWKII